MGRKLPNPQRLVRMFLRREAELSSRIENTFARVQTLVLLEDSPSIEASNPDIREVLNNFRALEFAVASIVSRPLGRGFIKELHQTLLQGVRGHDKTPGKFRTMQAHIGRSPNIADARFVPAPPHAIEASMESLEQFLQATDKLPPVVRAAMVHYQFEAIHPFADGNGRIGRALLLVQLINEGVLTAPLFNPSAMLEARRDNYYDLLLGVSQSGNWSGWCRFFAGCLADEASEAAKRIEQMEQLREAWYTLLRAPRASAMLPRLVDELLTNPSATAASVARTLSLTTPAAQHLIDKCVEKGILREITGQARNRVYLAQRVVDLFAVETK